MSQRLGMADGRCFTIYSANQLFNDYVMITNNIQLYDNYSYRKLLQQKGPAMIEQIQNVQQVGQIKRPNNYVNQCQSCDKPLLKIPGIY